MLTNETESRVKIEFGSWVEVVVTDYDYFILGWVRVKECPAGALSRRKAIVKIRKKNFGFYK